ncbi:hypothetical protein CS542_07825 [Pedobacter sp. IW39]|nr:hypothetical protein CS542_07825 [Pedobacter sp. IW39]
MSKSNIKQLMQRINYYRFTNRTDRSYNNTTGKFTIIGTPSTAGLITYTITATGDCKSKYNRSNVKPNVEFVLTTGSNNNQPVSTHRFRKPLTRSNGTRL